ncbi:bacitracin transport system permease protein [Seinonella peptonophila]|uniref:Bacitracin transport system permease protein n=1 Tax=Seinonella peptonophila TaxID=112248 RepID=A0A1M4YD49_9BACL|nr:ABC transporter permease [Seinonella peptonophila]SHF03667.1 bacitracin transport system permease protein [Seinonella peptonophila]
MVDLIYTELLKLKRANMVLVSLLGASAAPVIMFIAFLNMKSQKPDTEITFSVSFYNTNLNILMLLGVLLYGIITTYLFNREHEENTLKNLLTLPISRFKFMLSKMITLYLWIMLLTFFSWMLTLLLGLMGQFEGLSMEVLTNTMQQYLFGATLMLLMSTPTILVVFLTKSYVPTIIFNAVITLSNITLADSKYRVLFPWSAVHTIVSHSFVDDYAPILSYLSILIVSSISFVLATLYFYRLEIR